MLGTSLKLLKKIESAGFNAYIVGGFVRDRLLGLESVDVDITTNATPKDIRDIFPHGLLPSEAYGSVTLIVKNIHFEITTYRKESGYVLHRKPTVIEYIDNLMDDLKRRDFTINTICMDSDGNIIDLLGAKHDLELREIDTLVDADLSFEDDALRMLRAIRFATKLNFNLKKKVQDAIIKNKELLRELSYNRKRQELDKIFASNNSKYGIKLITELGLDKELELYNLSDIRLNTDLIGIWASLDMSPNYPFTNNEKELIRSIKEIVSSGIIDNKTLYKYGLYICSVASDLLNIDRTVVTMQYDSIPIITRKDIVIKSSDIINIVNKPAGGYIKDIYIDIEGRILTGYLNNDIDALKTYVKDKYG